MVHTYIYADQTFMCIKEYNIFKVFIGQGGTHTLIPALGGYSRKIKSYKLA